MFNMAQMMQKAQAMQKKMAELQEQLADVEVDGASGGGMVKITMTCKGIVKALDIDSSLIDKDEKDMLEDLVIAAVNDARAKADAKMASETEKAMKDMGLPAGALGGLPF